MPAMDESGALYKETIHWTEITIILGMMSVIFIMMAYMFFTKPEEGGAIAAIVMVCMVPIFLFLTLFFRKLDIIVHGQGLTVGWLYRKKEFSWDEIEGARKDDRSSLRYGGYGVRVAVVNGHWVLVYNVIRADRVVLTIKDRKYREFVFSTKKPDEVAMIINKWRKER